MKEFHQATHGASILQQRTSVHLRILPVDIEVGRCPGYKKQQLFRWLGRSTALFRVDF